jgi:23S rRNA pseudouridine2605 synthase
VPRIDKTLSMRGGYSRKIASKMIRHGRVSINGVPTFSPKLHCDEDCLLTVDGFEIPQTHSILLFHKPEGMLTAMVDHYGRDCVGDLVPPRYHIVGRLDLETRGLLLLSKDGARTQELLHPKRGIEREYIARVEGTPDESLREVLQQGVPTSVGLAQGELLSIEGSTLTVIMRGGRNRIVRRMLHNAGFSVLDLFRVRFGPFQLGDIEEGCNRPATPEELSQLRG